MRGMTQRSGARELGLIVAALAGTAHFLPTREAAAIALVAAAATIAGMVWLIGNWQPWREPLFPLALPVVATVSIAGIARLSGPVIPLVVILPAGWLLLAWVVDLELFGFFAPAPSERTPDLEPRRVRRVSTRRRPESELPQIVVEEVVEEPETPPHPRALAIRSAALGLAFLGFVAVGGFVAGALGEAGQRLSDRRLLEAVTLDAAVAGAIGFRLSALVAPAARDRMVRILAFIEYAAPVGLGAFALRTMELPRLFAPALLTLVVYVITIVRESSEPVLMNRRLLQELGVLVLVGAIAIFWGLAIK